MAYQKKTYRFPNAIEVEEYHSARYGAPGQVRQKRKKKTSEQMDQINQRNKEKRARRKLRQHFQVNDYFSVLTYRKECRPPDMETAKKHYTEFVRKVRREYQKRGCDLKWIRNIEVGTKGAWHIHMCINRIPDTDLIITKCWTHGRVTHQLLYEKGEFRDLARYITKTPKTDPRLRETSYSTSRNLPLPEPEKKTYPFWKTWRKIRIPNGYFLDQDSFYEGTDPAGYKCRLYTLLRVRRE